MRADLLTAAVLVFAVGAAHSALGERYIVKRLLGREDLPKLFGDDSFTKATLRFAWHLTTVAWWGIGWVLLLVAGAFPTLSVARGVLFAISATFAVSAVMTLTASRGRHLAWIVFGVISLLCAAAAF